MASSQRSRATNFGHQSIHGRLQQWLLCCPWSKAFFSGTVHIILPNHLVCTWACWEGTLFRSHQKFASVNECRIWMNLGIFISIHSTSLPAGGPLSLLHQSRARGRNDGHRCGRWVFWWFEVSTSRPYGSETKIHRCKAKSWISYDVMLCQPKGAQSHP